MKRFSSENQKVGRVGEDVACRFLEQKAFLIYERNYTKPWGEIDIVALKDKEIHFIEVKTISVLDDSEPWIRPAENMTPAKLKKCEHIAESYVMDKKVRGKWFYDAIFIIIHESERRAEVEFLENIFNG